MALKVKFLVVRFSSIGDIVLTTPVIRHLKKQVEGAEVHYLTKDTFASILRANPYVDRIHSFKGNMKETLQKLKEEGFDYIIDLHHNARSARVKLGLKKMDFSVNKLNRQKWLYVNLKINTLPDLHMVDRNMETIRHFIQVNDEEGLDYFIPEEEEIDLAGFPKAFGEGYVALAIGAQHETKKLPPDSLIALCNKLEYPLVILGGPGDTEAGRQIKEALPGRPVINGCGDFSIHQSASLVRQASLLISHDTGMMHIGAAFGKIIITIWGNTVPEFGMWPYGAHPESVRFEVDGLSCRPCSKIGYKNCPKKHFKCMKEQDLDAIARSAKQLMASFTGP